MAISPSPILRPGRLDPALSFPGRPEPIVGLAAMLPLALAGAVVAPMLARRLDEKDAGTRVGLYLVAGGWLVLFGLSTCWWVTVRYTLDFVMLTMMGAALCLEAAFARMSPLGYRGFTIRIAARLLAAGSIALGLLLGLRALAASPPP